MGQIHDEAAEARQPGPMESCTSRRTILKSMGAAGLATAFAVRGIPLAMARTNAYPQLGITARDFRFDLPASIPGGYTEITLKNAGGADHHAMLMRLNEGKTVDEFMATARDKDLGALFSISRSMGGPGSINPGRQTSVILDLQPGRYVVICMIPDAAGMPHYKMGMLAPLTVTGATRAGTPPTAQTTVDLLDFSFIDLPDKFPAGRHLWKVIDTSDQLHEMILNRLAPGVSFEQVKAMLMASPPDASSTPKNPDASPPPAGPAPFVGLAGVAPMSPGAIDWAVLDLMAGDYFAICYVPDVKTGAPHFMLGMIKPFTVT